MPDAERDLALAHRFQNGGNFRRRPGHPPKNIEPTAMQAERTSARSRQALLLGLIGVVIFGRPCQLILNNE